MNSPLLDHLIRTAKPLLCSSLLVLPLLANDVAAGTDQVEVCLVNYDFTSPATGTFGNVPISYGGPTKAGPQYTFANDAVSLAPATSGPATTGAGAPAP